MGYDRDEAMRIQEATEAMIRQRNNSFNISGNSISVVLKRKDSPPLIRTPDNSGQRDPAVMTDSGGGDTGSALPLEDQK